VGRIHRRIFHFIVHVYLGWENSGILMRTALLNNRNRLRIIMGATEKHSRHRFNPADRCIRCSAWLHLFSSIPYVSHMTGDNACRETPAAGVSQWCGLSKLPVNKQWSPSLHANESAYERRFKRCSQKEDWELAEMNLLCLDEQKQEAVK